MSEPPSLAGATKLTAAALFPRVAETPVGASGTVAGVTETDDDSTLSPTAFVACTVNV
jgi:hypothetical protein